MYFTMFKLCSVSMREEEEGRRGCQRNQGEAVCWRGGKKTVMEISRGEQSDQLAARRPDVQNDGEEEKRITSA